MTSSIVAATDLDDIARECANLLETDFSEDLDQLFALGGSSGGARPKILTEVDGEEWIIKFPSSVDSANIVQVSSCNTIFNVRRWFIFQGSHTA